jgi:hypothetical protein
VFLPLAGELKAQESHLSSQRLLNSLAIDIRKNQNKKIGLIDALSRNGFLVLPNSRAIGTDKTKLPARADSALDQQIDELLVGFPEGAPNLTLLTFSSIKIGGLYTVEGSGDCENWRIFNYDFRSSHVLPTPTIFQPDMCTKDGSQSYLALIDHQLAALDVEVIPLDQDQGFRPTRIGLRLTLQSWNGEGWDNPAVLKLGYK